MKKIKNRIVVVIICALLLVSSSNVVGVANYIEDGSVTTGIFIKMDDPKPVTH